jgi:cytochrome c-type biogenesis protein CcmE
MKIQHIIILIAMAVLVAFLGVNFSQSASIYTDFATARQTSKDVHIVGRWVNRESASYDASQDLFTFHLEDTLSQVQQVYYYDPKPINFEQAEKVVIVGGFRKGQFVADKIIMKCPSKYDTPTLTQQ